MGNAGKRISTTHVGSLPRPESLVALLQQKHRGEPYCETEFNRAVADAVSEVVKKQIDVGVDIVGDGEMGKISYASYITTRLNGFGGKPRKGHVAQDLADFRNLAMRLVAIGAVIPDTSGYACTGPVSAGDDKELRADLENLQKAKDAMSPIGTFMSAASPGVITVFQQNEYYDNEDEYIEAVAEAMRPEYEAIVAAGHVLQLDCPDLAMNRHLGFARESQEAFLASVERNVAAINHATRNIAPAAMRLHLCWGNYEGPHHRDIPLRDILPAVLKARPAGLLFEAANCRHAHEFVDFVEVAIPEDKILIPGVLDTCTNYVEHPELIAQRLCRFADFVGPERIMAGNDCGFSTFAGYPTVDPEVVWAKFESMAQGVRLAEERLFNAK